MDKNVKLLIGIGGVGSKVSDRIKEMLEKKKGAPILIIDEEKKKKDENSDD